PACQFGSQPRVLSITPDRQAQLILADNHRGSSVPFRFRKIHAAHTRRTDCFRNINNGIRIPLDDIDLFVMQFLDDRLDAHTLDAHACTNRIDTRLRGHDRYLGTCTRFARDRADLHHTVVNLRHFVLEQTTQEIAVRPREDNLWAARAILDLQHHRPDAFMYLESLPGDPL